MSRKHLSRIKQFIVASSTAVESLKNFKQRRSTNVKQPKELLLKRIVPRPMIIELLLAGAPGRYEYRLLYCMMCNHYVEM